MARQDITDPDADDRTALPSGGLTDAGRDSGDAACATPLGTTRPIDSEIAALTHAKMAAEAANEAKSRYLVAVSHEIRSPLSAIYGYAQLLELGDAVSSTEAGAVIRRSAEHLSNLVESLLEISRVENGVLKIRSDIIDLHALLKQVVEMFRVQANAKGLYLILRMSDGVPRHVKTDEKRLRQILINLISNAIKYTREGGVTVAVGYRSQVADIEVSDTGIGIAPEDMGRIFEPFERGSSAEAKLQPGIGLGLAITCLLARIMGGDVAAASMPGTGSRFTLKLMLPTPSTPVASVPTRNRITGYRGDRRKVLIVDDDPAHIVVLQSLLRSLGFIVYAAGAGHEGLMLAIRCLPDFALLDIQMPGMNGWETAEKLRTACGNGVKIIMVSANAAEFRPADVNITKPFNFDALLTVIGDQLCLQWDRADTTASSSDEQVPPPLPAASAPLLEKIRYLTTIGHVDAIERQLADLERAIPAAGGLVTELRRLLVSFDLAALLKKLDNAELR